MFKFRKKSPPESASPSGNVFENIFTQAAEGWAKARGNPSAIAAAQKQHEETLRKLQALGPQIEASYKELERTRQELAKSSDAFRQKLADIAAAGDAMLRRQEEETRSWQNSGCPTTTDVVAMKPLRLGAGTAMRA